MSEHSKNSGQWTLVAYWHALLALIAMAKLMCDTVAQSSYYSAIM